MKKFFASLALIVGLALFTTAHAAGPYYPITQESATQAVTDVRTTFWGDEFGPSYAEKFDNVILTNNGPNNSAAYRETLGVYSMEDFVALMSIGWDLDAPISSKDDVRMFVPISVLDKHTDYKMYWVINTDLMQINNPVDNVMIGLLNHDYGHLWDMRNRFTIDAGYNSFDDIVDYGAREQMNDIFVYTVKGQMGSIRPAYEMAVWIHGLPFFPKTYTPEHPYIEWYTTLPQLRPEDITTLFFRRMELQIARNPGKTLVEALGAQYSSDYEYFMSLVQE